MGKSKVRTVSTIGFLYGVAAYILWGILPLYWKLLDDVNPLEILAHRIFWSFIFMVGILFFQKKLHTCKEVLKTKGNVLKILGATIFITINWGMYIWSVNSERVVEASMGYYINPLVVILLGVLVLKEKLNRWQVISLILATLGVVVITVRYGQIPWISLTLAFSFAFYGLMKKMVPVGSVVGLALETTLLFPITLGFILFRQFKGLGALGTLSLEVTVVLIGAGLVTALPLLFFAEGTRRIPLSSMGFLQYIAPTISLFLGIFVFKEQFTLAHFLSFGLIWVGLVIYSISQFAEMRKAKYRITSNV